MLKPIVCDNCHKEVKELPFRIEWDYQKNKCDCCHNVETQTRRYEFCSSKCLRLWTQKFDGHKHQWDITPLTGGALTKKGEVLSVTAHCKICKETDWHNKDKKLIERYKKWHGPYLTLSKNLNENDYTRHSKKSVHKQKK